VIEPSQKGIYFPSNFFAGFRATVTQWGLAENILLPNAEPLFKFGLIHLEHWMLVTAWQLASYAGLDAVGHDQEGEGDCRNPVHHRAPCFGALLAALLRIANSPPKIIHQHQKK
jgi:hypothetical protein